MQAFIASVSELLGPAFTPVTTIVFFTYLFMLVAVFSWVRSQFFLEKNPPGFIPTSTLIFYGSVFILSVFWPLVLLWIKLIFPITKWLGKHL